MRNRDRAALFAIGAIGYPALEILYRRRTHWSMALAGGACFSLLYAVHGKNRPLPLRCALGAACITAVEFITGLVVNRWLRLNVWDYSKNRLNLMGQICPHFTALWFGLSALLSPACRGLRLYFSRAIAYNQGQDEA